MSYVYPIIQAATALYGAYQSHRSNQRAKDQMKRQNELAEQAIPYAKEYTDQARSAIGPTLGYYTSVLANPREAMAPEQNRISTMYTGQAQNARTMAPRGGASLSSAENLRGQERGAQTNAILSGRPMAAQALGSMGSGLASLGLQGYGLGANILGNVFQQGLQARQQQGQEGQNIGQGLFNAYQMYMLQNSLNTKDTGGGGGGGQDSMWSWGSPGNSTGDVNSGKGWPMFGGTMAGSNLYGNTSTLPNSGRSGVQ